MPWVTPRWSSVAAKHIFLRTIKNWRQTRIWNGLEGPFKGKVFLWPPKPERFPWRAVKALKEAIQLQSKSLKNFKVPETRLPVQHQFHCWDVSIMRQPLITQSHCLPQQCLLQVTVWITPIEGTYTIFLSILSIWCVRPLLYLLHTVQPLHWM